MPSPLQRWRCSLFPSIGVPLVAHSSNGTLLKNSFPTFSPTLYVTPSSSPFLVLSADSHSVCYWLLCAFPKAGPTAGLLPRTLKFSVAFPFLSHFSFLVLVFLLPQAGAGPTRTYRAQFHSLLLPGHILPKRYAQALRLCPAGKWKQRARSACRTHAPW